MFVVGSLLVVAGFTIKDEGVARQLQQTAYMLAPAALVAACLLPLAKRYAVLSECLGPSILIVSATSLIFINHGAFEEVDFPMRQ